MAKTNHKKAAPARAQKEAIPRTQKGLTLDAETHDEIAALAARTGRTMKGMVRILLKSYTAQEGATQ